MGYISYKTSYLNKQCVNKDWFVVDASLYRLGRLASQVAYIIRGKHKPSFTPHVDCGDHVVVINAEKVGLSGKKWDRKLYRTYTGYPGGLKSAALKQMSSVHPERVIEHAVRGMLPKNRLGRAMFRNLHVCRGDTHKYVAQKPSELKLRY